MIRTTSTPPSWRDVFDTTHKHWGHIALAADGAVIAGYPYFLWNGRVYESLYGESTGWLLEEVTGG